MAVKTVPELLEEAAATYRERNEAYGDSKRFGKIMAGLFPEGVELNTIDEFNRIGYINMIVGKLMRYCNQFYEGGHEDSSHDMIVYAALLTEFDALEKEHLRVIREESPIQTGEE